jgi:hypothetical protein
MEDIVDQAFFALYHPKDYLAYRLQGWVKPLWKWNPKLAEWLCRRTGGHLARWYDPMPTSGRNLSDFTCKLCRVEYVLSEDGILGD